jgi:Transposase DDE domain
MRVRALGGEGTVRGYRTLNVLGVGTGGVRALLDHRLFSSEADDFVSESREIQEALATVGDALAAQRGRVTYLMDSQFDDVAVWGTIWEQGNHLVCRLKHEERLVELPPDPARKGPDRLPLDQARRGLRELARVRTEMLVRKVGQRFTKRQPTTAVVSARPLQVTFRAGARTPDPGPPQTKRVWLVEVRLENVAEDPWLLLTDWPVEDEAGAARVFRMYRTRWAVEDCFKFTKDVLGWEDVQLLHFEGVRTLVALGWVAAGFLYELGVSFDWPEIRLLARLGGGELRPTRPPGKTTLTRGLQRLLDHWATDAILADEIRRHGALPPKIAAFLGPNWKPAS